MVAPDWMDPSRTRWQVHLQTSTFGAAKIYPTEEDARLAAFNVTGVGDFLAGATWVEGWGFRFQLLN